MDQVWTFIIGPIIGALAGSLSTFAFFPQVRKSKILENEAKQSEEWKKLYDEERRMREADLKAWSEERSHLHEKIDGLYDQIKQHRDEKAEMAKKNAELEVTNTRLTMLKCEVVNCPNRKPPTGY